MLGRTTAGSPDGTTSFGGLLRDLRERAGLTQEELAARAGLTPHGVGALERGVRTRPYPHTVRSLADALGLADDDRARLVAAVPRRPPRAASAAPPADPGGPGGDTAPGPPGPAGGAGGRGRASAPVTPLVVPPTSLHGRDDDVAEVVSLVRGGARLVTLTGPGGVGKTRLAAAAAAALRDGHPDGNVAVPLVPLLDPADVVPAVARATGADGDGLDAVVDRLTGCRLLLVLDNFEHLLPAAQDVGVLVARCPELTVLVSSRAPLRVRGEAEHPVPPLALPSRGTRDLAALAASAAGALALERARAAAPGAGAPTGDDVEALAELCHVLAGLPLALELATARLRLLTPGELLDRLDELSPASAARDLPERQRTMRAALDWSHDLLSGPERTVFHVLGVFRGGAVLTAVEQVVAASTDVAREQVVGLLSALVEHSLVTAARGPGGAVRYGMLEPVAQYARLHLRGEELLAVEAAHAEWAADFADRLAPALEREEQVAWLERTDAEEANLLVAVERALAGGGALTATRIVWSTWLYWWMRGRISTGRRAAEHALGAAGDAVPVEWRARLHLVLASMAFAADDVPVATAEWAMARSLAPADMPAVVAGATAGSGLTALAVGDLPGAERWFGTGLANAERAGEEGSWLRSLTHVWLGTVALLRGDVDVAAREATTGLSLARERGDRLVSYVALFTLARVALAHGSAGEARDRLHEACRLSVETGDAANLAFVLDMLAVVESADARHDRVPVLVGAALGLRESGSAPVYGFYVPDGEAYDAAVARSREVLGPDGFDDALDRGRGLDVAACAALVLGG
ncbi:ATP-binding protein [Aquipuribacter sp. SD81]|uniref:ATP-binding protein n=1 Tax=Aquipuribacter sp. SD81 TaxID=3127703 RepID=UPI003018A1D9